MWVGIACSIIRLYKPHQQYVNEFRQKPVIAQVLDKPRER